MKLRFIPIILLTASVYFHAQVVPQGNNAENTELVGNQNQEYVLKDIVVDGVKRYTPAQILRFTGLVKGEKLEIPGQRVSSAVKKLWETQSFSKVEVYVQDVEGQNVILQFQLQDLKELGEIKFTGKGIGKSKNEKLIKDNNLKPGTKINNNLVSSLQNKIPQEYIAKGFADAKINIRKKLMQEILIWWTGQLK
jgi:outer membrane protein insertion porin family